MSRALIILISCAACITCIVAAVDAIDKKDHVLAQYELITNELDKYQEALQKSNRMDATLDSIYVVQYIGYKRWEIFQTSRLNPYVPPIWFIEPQYYPTSH